MVRWNRSERSRRAPRFRRTLCSSAPHRLAGPHGPLASSGVELKLAPKTLAVLWTLAVAPGRAFTKAPLLEAVSRLRRDPRGEHALQILRRHAPSWLAQLPTLPDGTVDGCYRFRHALYRDALVARLGPGQRARLRAAIVARKPTAFRTAWPARDRSRPTPSLVRSA